MCGNHNALKYQLTLAFAGAYELIHIQNRLLGIVRYLYVHSPTSSFVSNSNSFEGFLSQNGCVTVADEDICPGHVPGSNTNGSSRILKFSG